ncbi:MAG: hypothetical protein R3B68_14105 [Phycisphaerales bacterium]
MGQFRRRPGNARVARVQVGLGSPEFQPGGLEPTALDVVLSDTKRRLEARPRQPPGLGRPVDEPDLNLPPRLGLLGLAIGRQQLGAGQHERVDPLAHVDEQVGVGLGLDDPGALGLKQILERPHRLRHVARPQQAFEPGERIARPRRVVHVHGVDRLCHSVGARQPRPPRHTRRFRTIEASEAIAHPVLGRRRTPPPSRPVRLIAMLGAS